MLRHLLKRPVQQNHPVRFHLASAAYRILPQKIAVPAAGQIIIIIDILGSVQALQRLKIQFRLLPLCPVPIGHASALPVIPHYRAAGLQ